MTSRKPTADEATLLEYLVSIATEAIPEDWKETLMVASREDETGSLYLFPRPDLGASRVYGKTISEYQVSEAGVLVIASLNVDTNGELFELDIWRGPLDPHQGINLN